MHRGVLYYTTADGCSEETNRQNTEANAAQLDKIIQQNVSDSIIRSIKVAYGLVVQIL